MNFNLKIIVLLYIIMSISFTEKTLKLSNSIGINPQGVFGKDCVVSGDYAAVSKWEHTGSNPNAVYIFKKETVNFEVTWSCVQEISGQQIAYDGFGISLAMRGDILAIGSRASYTNSAQRASYEKGGVYIYKRNGSGDYIAHNPLSRSTGWKDAVNEPQSQPHVLYPSSNTEFGTNVDLWWDGVYEYRLVVSQNGHREVTLFKFDDTDSTTRANGWVQLTFTVSEVNSTSLKERPVSIYENYFCVGEYGYETAADNNESNIQSSHVIVYKYTGTGWNNSNWNFDVLLKNTDWNQTTSPNGYTSSYVNDEFGFDVSMFNNNILVGAGRGGKAYIYKKDSNGDWGTADVSVTTNGETKTYRSQSQIIESTTADASSKFAKRVRISSNDYFVISAQGKTVNGRTNVGSLYLYKLISGIWEEYTTGQIVPDIPTGTSNGTESWGVTSSSPSFGSNLDFDGTTIISVGEQFYNNDAADSASTTYTGMSAVFTFADGGYSGPPDTTAPIFSSASVSEEAATVVEIIFDEDINSGADIQVSDFVVTVGGTTVNISVAAIASGKVNITLGDRIHVDEVVTIAYTKSGVSANNIADSEGNAVATFASQSVTNSTTYEAPSFSIYDIHESTIVRDRTNKIRVLVRPDNTLTAGQEIRITGLTGTATVDNSTMDITGAGASLFTGNQGSWTQSSGTFFVTVAAGKTVPSTSDTEFIFEVVNPSSANGTGNTVDISGTGLAKKTSLFHLISAQSPSVFDALYNDRYFLWFNYGGIVTGPYGYEYAPKGTEGPVVGADFGKDHARSKQWYTTANGGFRSQRWSDLYTGGTDGGATWKLPASINNLVIGESKYTSHNLGNLDTLGCVSGDGGDSNYFTQNIFNGTQSRRVRSSDENSNYEGKRGTRLNSDDPARNTDKIFPYGTTYGDTGATPNSNDTGPLSSSTEFAKTYYIENDRKFTSITGIGAQHSAWGNELKYISGSLMGTDYSGATLTSKNQTFRFKFTLDRHPPVWEQTTVCDISGCPTPIEEAVSASVASNVQTAITSSTVVSATVSNDGKLDATNSGVIAAIAAMKAEIAAAVENNSSSSRRKKRTATLKLLFSQNSKVKKIKMKKEDLSLPATFTKSDVVVIKAGETIDIDDFDSTEGVDSGFYSVLGNGEKIVFIVSGKTITFTRTDDGGIEKYSVSNPSNATISDVTTTGSYNPSSNPTGDLKPGDKFTVENSRIFLIGSVSDGGPVSSGNNTPASSGADPYVNPIKGPTYKLPNKKAYYRLYEKDDVFINGAVKKASDKKVEEIKKYFGNSNLDGEIVSDGYFYSSYFIAVGDKKFVLDLKSFKFLTTKNSHDFFKFKIDEEYVSGTWENGKALVLNVSWTHPTHGIMGLDIVKYENPQIDSMIRLKNYPSIENTVGVLIKNYKPKLMQIPKLNSAKPGKIARKLSKAKNKFTKKAYMQKGENWIINGKSYI